MRQTDEMNERKYRINADESFYKQEYCGCSYSLRDNNYFRKKNGQPSIVIGGGGVYADPVADSLEESKEVVEGFFKENMADDNAMRKLYGKRKKSEAGDGSGNNW